VIYWPAFNANRWWDNQTANIRASRKENSFLGAKICGIWPAVNDPALLASMAALKKQDI
jgi:hypothetical protein